MDVKHDPVALSGFKGWLTLAGLMEPSEAAALSCELACPTPSETLHTTLQVTNSAPQERDRKTTKTNRKKRLTGSAHGTCGQESAQLNRASWHTSAPTKKATATTTTTTTD